MSTLYYKTLFPLLNLLEYGAIRLMGFPLAFMSYPQIQTLGKKIGTLLFFLDRPRRKRALSNLAALTSYSAKEREAIAREAFQNLSITCLEFFRLKRSKHRLAQDLVSFENLDAVLEAHKKGKGLILFAGHQANWEAPFIVLTTLFPKGIAIGKTISNNLLYRWILSIREMHGGKIITPKNALKQGSQTLREGGFIGFVGDQAMPLSSYAYPLLGTMAWTSPAPALLAYRNQAPISCTMIRRENHRYIVSFSPPQWPDTTRPMKQEVVRLMDTTLRAFEESIRRHPGQWLWQHNRWKQNHINHILRKYRHDFILLLLPKDFDTQHLELFQQLYPRGFFTIATPYPISFPAKLFIYEKEEEILSLEPGYQIVFDFIDSPTLRRHFKKLAFQIVTSTKKGKALKQQLWHTLCKPNAN